MELVVKVFSQEISSSRERERGREREREREKGRERERERAYIIYCKYYNNDIYTYIWIRDTYARRCLQIDEQLPWPSRSRCPVALAISSIAAPPALHIDFYYHDQENRARDEENIRRVLCRVWSVEIGREFEGVARRTGTRPRNIMN